MEASDNLLETLENLNEVVAISTNINLDKKPIEVSVSIAPLAYFVSRIGGEHVRIHVLLPPGAVPESTRPAAAPINAPSAMERPVSAPTMAPAPAPIPAPVAARSPGSLPQAARKSIATVDKAIADRVII